MATKKAAKKKTVVTDASSLILLAKSGLFELVAKHLDLIVTDKVYEEAVIKGKVKGHADSYELEIFYQAGHFQLSSPKQVSLQRIETLFRLHGGERDTVALAHELGCGVLVDDRKGINACKALGLQFATALGVVLSLLRQGIINQAQAF